MKETACPGPEKRRTPLYASLFLMTIGMLMTEPYHHQPDQTPTPTKEVIVYQATPTPGTPGPTETLDPNVQLKQTPFAQAINLDGDLEEGDQ